MFKFGLDGNFDRVLGASEIEALGFVPYTGATAALDMGVYAITTTGTGTFGSTSAGIVLNDANSNFHIYGKTANDYGKVDTGIDFISVAKPDYISNLANLGAGNVDTGKHYYHVEFYTVWGSTGIKSYSSAPSITLGSASEVRVTIPVSTDYTSNRKKNLQN